MLLRLSATALAALVAVSLTGTVEAHAVTAAAPAPTLRVVPDTRTELRDLPRAPRVEAAPPAPVVEETPVDAPAPVEAPAPPAPAARRGVADRG